MTDLTNKTVDELRATITEASCIYGPVWDTGMFDPALDELARRAQANDALRSAAQDVVTNAREIEWQTLDGPFHVKHTAFEITTKDLIALREALAAAPTAASSGAPAPADPWTPVQCDYDRNIHANPDANAWADFFVQVHPRLADKHEVMRGWFANAMMAMHDSPRCKPAPADSQREAAIEAWRKSATDTRASVIYRDGPSGWEELALDDVFEVHAKTIDEAVSLMRSASAPPAPAAPVTEGEVEAAIVELDCASHNCGVNGVSDENGDDAFTIKARDALRSLIARRVAEARGAGLRELRAWAVSQREHGGFNWKESMGYLIERIDRLLAAPAASKLAEEPAQEDDGPCLSAMLANMRMEMSDGANGMRTPREEAIAAVVECVARRIEALENNKEAGK